MTEDGALVERLKAGDRLAFDEVYARYHARVYGFLLRMVLDRAVAEDLHQETWVRFARGVHGLRESDKLAGWLFRVARNLATSRARRRRLEVSAAATWTTAQDGEGGEPSPHDHLVAERQRQRLEAGLAALEPADRELILLVAVEGSTPLEAAGILGLQPATLRKRLERARQRLRTLIEEGSPSDPEETP